MSIEAIAYLLRWTFFLTGAFMILTGGLVACGVVWWWLVDKLLRQLGYWPRFWRALQIMWREKVREDERRIGLGSGGAP